MANMMEDTAAAAALEWKMEVWQAVEDAARSRRGVVHYNVNIKFSVFTTHNKPTAFELRWTSELRLNCIHERRSNAVNG